MRAIAVLACLVAFAGCTAPPGPPLLSTQFPPGTGVVNSNSPFQSANSLPPGAANVSTAPGATSPDVARLAFRGF